MRATLWRSAPFAVVSALLLFGTTAPTTSASESNDGAGFLVVSVSSTFDLPDVSQHCQSSSDGGCHDNRCGCKKRKRNDKKNCTCDLPEGSALVVVPIGTFVAGYDVRNTFFETSGETTSDALADVIAGLGGIEGLDGNQATIFGAVDTTGPNSIHLLTPDPGAVPAEVQEAIFFATPALLALDPADPLYPDTTVELAEFIWQNQAPEDVTPLVPQATLQQILDYLFLSGNTLDCTLCEVEGTLFPHDPDTEDPLISFTLTFDEDGNVTAEGCTLVSVAVRPGGGDGDDPIDLAEDGEVVVTILSSRGERPDENGETETVTFFDPSDVDPDTVTVGAAKQHGATGEDWVGASPFESFFEDVNDDGVDDLILCFYNGDLADPDLGGMTGDTTVVEILGDTYDQGCIQGTDTVSVVSD